MTIRYAKFAIGQVVRHRDFPFRGVVIDVDPVYAHGDAWWAAIPEAVRPACEQPFYHLLAEGMDEAHAAYVSESHLVADDSGEPVDHPEAGKVFARFADGRYTPRPRPLN